MARYSGSRSRVARRIGVDTGAFGTRSLSSKCRGRETTRPGQHGAKGKHLGDYALQLNEKQKLRAIYGVLERQFRRYYKLASLMKGGTGENLLQILESRLDNVVYRMGFAMTRAEARQLVSHRGVLLNDQLVNIPSALVKPGDMIEVKAKGQLRVQAANETSQQRSVTTWVDVDSKNFKGTFKTYPVLTDFPNYNVNLVVELYSK